MNIKKIFNAIQTFHEAQNAAVNIDFDGPLGIATNAMEDLLVDVADEMLGGEWASWWNSGS